VLLGRRQEAKGMPDRLTAAQKQTVLQVLALKGMQRNTREFKLVTACLLIRQRLETVAGSGADPEQFIRQIENISGLLVEREQGIYEFAHKSFQEYLAAVQTKEIHQEMLLARHIDDPWWEETIRLYAAQTNASYLIQTAIDRNTVGALTIAYDCLQEGLSIDAKIRRSLETTLEEGLESTDPEIFKLAAEVKLSRRLKNLLRIDEKTEIDMSYITCAEYQLFIDEKRSIGLNRQPDHWTSYRFNPGDANKPIAGVRASDAIEFCEWLTTRSSVLGDVYEEEGDRVFVGAFRFRIPGLAEVEAYPTTGHQPEIGHWYCYGYQLLIAEIAPAQLQVWSHNFNKLLDVDRDFVFASASDNPSNDVFRRELRAIKRNIASDFEFCLNLVLTFEQVPNLDFVFKIIEAGHESGLVLTSNNILGSRHNCEVFYSRSLKNYQDFNRLRAVYIFAVSVWYGLSDDYAKNAKDHRDCKALSVQYIHKSKEAFRLYALSVLIDERKAGKISAWEGIRVVRERVSNVD
jgi:hypothetical protein